MNLIVGLIGAILVLLGMMKFLEIISGHLRKKESSGEQVALTDVFGFVRDLDRPTPPITRENIMNGTIAITFAMGRVDEALSTCDLLGIDKTPITQGGGATMFKIENGKAVESKNPKYYVTTPYLGKVLDAKKLLKGVSDGDVFLNLGSDRFTTFTLKPDVVASSDLIEINRYFEADISDVFANTEFRYAQIRNRKAIGHKNCPINLHTDRVANVVKAIRNVEMFEEK